MLYTLFIISTLIYSGLFLYFVEWVYQGHILYWSIPLVLIGAYIFSLLVFFVVLIICNLFFSRPAKKLERPRSFQKYVTQQACSYILKVFRIVPVVKHAERLPKDSQYMLVCNHQAIFDPMAIIWAFKDQDITFIMKKEVLNIPIVGTWLKAAGFLPIDRSDDRSAVKTIKTASQRIENNINSIGVYPEGTRSHGPNVREFKHGTFKIAEWSKCPIVVCSIDNAYKIRYHSIFKKKQILLEVVGVIPYEDYKGKNTTELSDITHEMMVSSIEKRRQQIEWLKKQTEEELESETIIGSFKKKNRKK